MSEIILSQDIKQEYLAKAKSSYLELKRVKPTTDLMRTFIDVALYSGVGEMQDIVENADKPIEKVAAFNALLSASKHIETRNQGLKEDDDALEIDYEEIMGSPRELTNG